MLLRASVGVSLLFAGALSVCALRVEDSGWLLANVHVVDLEQERVLDGQSVRIRDDRIVSMGAASRLGNAAEPRQIDGQGSFVIPGLYDMHVHLGTTGVVADTALAGRVEQGVLGVRDMGFPIDSLPVLAKLARSAGGEGAPVPRIWYVGPTLNAPSTRSFPFHVQVTDSDAITSIVARIAAAGGMAVKIHDRLSRETYAQVAAAARARGLSVVGHVPALVPIEDVIKERQRSVEHLGGLTHGILMACSRDPTSRQRAAAALVPEDFFRLARVTMSAEHLTPLLDGFDATRCAAVARRLQEVGSWQVPTLLMWKAWATTGGDVPETPSADDVAARRRLYRTMLDISRIFYAEHVPIMAGTDNVGSIHDELAALVDAGLRPVDVLRAATVQPARFLNAAASSGLVKPGFHADLVLLKGNPLVDIGNTRRVVGVVLRGKYRQVTTAISQAR